MFEHKSKKIFPFLKVFTNFYIKQKNQSVRSLRMIQKYLLNLALTFKNIFVKIFICIVIISFFNCSSKTVENNLKR